MSRAWRAVGALAVVLVLGLWAAHTWRLQQANRQLALSMEAERQRNFHALAQHVGELQGLLAKGLVTGSARLNLHFMGEVRRHTAAAVSHLTGLPLPGPFSAATGKFLAQTGDFAYTLARREAAGQPMTAADRAQLAQLHETAGAVNASIQELALRGVRWEEPQPTGLAGMFRAALPPRKPSPDPQSPMSLAPGGFEQVENQVGQLPTLVYDGPFADQVAARPPLVTGPPVSRTEAEARLERYLPGPGRWRVAGVTESGGTLPTWSFDLVPAAGGSEPALAVDVARAGGFLVELVNSRSAGAPTLDLDGARAIGQDYLAAAGFPDMEPAYAEAADGFATIQFVHRQGEVRVYPDQIKVKVALDNGEVVGVDAVPYLMHHRERSPGNPLLSPEEAQEALRPDLEVDDVRLAIIPDAAGTGEVLAYEFRALREQGTFLVYVNARTGAEEQVLQLMESDSGTYAQ